MKKIAVIMLSFLLLPVLVSGAEYDIEHFYIDATLKTNGDMDVSELIVLDGTFNGYERDIVYSLNDNDYNALGITNLRIYGKEVYGSVSLDSFQDDFEDFSAVNSAENGDSNKYILSDISGGKRVRMYYSTYNSTTAFLIKYTLKDVGILHEDVVEYYWNFIGNDFEDNINDIKIRVNYPNKFEMEDFNWWFHGDLMGESHIDEDSFDYTSVIASLSYLKRNTPVDFRTLVDKNYYGALTFSKSDNATVRESIVAHEDDIVRKDNERRQRERELLETFDSLCVAFYIFLIATWIYVYKKYDKERKPEFIHKYNREFIDDYNVEVVDYLMNNNITPNALSASIMNLIYKKNIVVEKEADGKNYKFTLKNRDRLNDTENSLVDFLFLTVGNNSEEDSDLIFTSKELKDYAKSTKTCDDFMASYTAWKNKVLEDGKKMNFYDSLGERFKYAILVLVVACILYFFGVVVYHINTLLLNSVVFAAIIFLIYVGCIKRKSKRGIEDYAKWKAFKNFLNDFAVFETKDLPEIILWERYLVYATVFGLAKKVEKEMNVKIKEMNIDDSIYRDTYFYSHNVNVVSDINTMIMSSYQGAQSTITRVSASSSDGSFGGHGGGFSSGGGFGGGGGGGRGF